ncbi:MAG: hypothetical protein ACRCZE_03370 [Candidatus Altimarinota bacterium]
MSNFGGKYFEQIIARLMKAKEAENYQMRADFKVQLREQLLNRTAPEILPESNGFEWASFWAKWKYALGAVPTMAILAIVAVNAFDQKVVMTQPEQAFQNTLQNNDSAQMKVMDAQPQTMSMEMVNNEGIKTFPGYLAMPSEEALRNFRQNEDGVKLPMMNTNLTELKIDDPNASLEKVNFDGLKTDFIDPVEKPDNAQFTILINENPVGNSVVVPNEPVVSDDLGSQKLMMESEVSDLPVGGMGGEVMDATVDQAMELDVGNILMTESLSVEEVKADLEKENALKQLDEQKTPIANQVSNTELMEESAMDSLRFNVVEEYSAPAIYTPEINLNQHFWLNNNALMESGRVYYEGEKRDLLNAFVQNEIVSRSGVLSGDYYFEGQDLEEGVFKLTLWEFGQKSKIYILKEEPYGLRVITEVDF